MAKVEWSSGINHVSGALSKPGKNPQHSCEKMLLATHRVKPTESKDCNRLYLRSKIVRSTAPGEDELWARNRFTAVAAAVKTRRKDLSHIATDMQAFEAQKNTSGGKKTMKAYLWLVCGQEYDQAHPRS